MIYYGLRFLTLTAYLRYFKYYNEESYTLHATLMVLLGLQVIWFIVANLFFWRKSKYHQCWIEMDA